MSPSGFVGFTKQLRRHTVLERFLVSQAHTIPQAHDMPENIVIWHAAAAGSDANLERHLNFAQDPLELLCAA